MKKVFLSLIAFGALALTSCTSDPCKDKSATTLCSGNGTLVSNSGASTCDCSCNLPSWGTDCSKTYNGTYAASADAYNGNVKSPYNVTISLVGTSAGSTITLIGAFPYVYGGSGQTFTGTLGTDGKTITIANQDPSSPSLGYKVAATGTLSNNGTKAIISWNTVTVTQTSSGSTLPVTGSWTQL